MKLGNYKREMSAALAFAALLLLIGFIAPSFFTATNLRDLALNNAPVLLVAVGMTLVILVGEIDIRLVHSSRCAASRRVGWRNRVSQ